MAPTHRDKTADPGGTPKGHGPCGGPLANVGGGGLIYEGLMEWGTALGLSAGSDFWGRLIAHFISEIWDTREGFGRRFLFAGHTLRTES